MPDRWRAICAVRNDEISDEVIGRLCWCEAGDGGGGARGPMLAQIAVRLVALVKVCSRCDRNGALGLAAGATARLVTVTGKGPTRVVHDKRLLKQQFLRLCRTEVAIERGLCLCKATGGVGVGLDKRDAAALGGSVSIALVAPSGVAAAMAAETLVP